MSTPHAKKSPSRFQRIRLCPASYLAEAPYPRAPSGPSAIDGTHTHTLLEYCLIHNTPAMKMLGLTMNDHEGEFVVDGERANRVQVALDYIEKRAMVELQCGMQSVQSEAKLYSRAAFGRDDMDGTCDVQIVDLPSRTLEVIDYKDGMGPVDLPCDQLEIYGIMALSEYPEDRFDTVRLTIIQPKLAYRGDDGIIFQDIPAKELWEKRLVYKAAAEACELPGAPFNPGDLQCKYCAHKGACSALKDKTMEACNIFSPVDVASQAAGKDVGTLSNDQLRELLEGAPLLRELLNSAEAEALRRLMAGQTIDGLKVVRGRGSRQWAFDEDEMATKLKKFGLPKDAIYKTTLISPAQAEKVVWQKRDKTPVQLSARQLKTMNEEYVKKTEGKLTVAPATDDRPAVTISAEPLFAAVEVETEVVPSWLK